MLKFCGWQQLDLNTDNVRFIHGDTVHAAVHRKVAILMSEMKRELSRELTDELKISAPNLNQWN